MVICSKMRLGVIVYRANYVCFASGRSFGSEFCRLHVLSNLFYFFLSSSFVFIFLKVSGPVAHVCCACYVQYGGITLHFLLSFLHYNVVYLCRSVLATELASLSHEVTARTLGVLGFNGLQ